MISPLDFEQLDIAFVWISEGSKFPVQYDVASVQLNSDLSAQNTRVSDLEWDTFRKRAGDASNCDLSEDGDVQDHGKRETQVDGVIGDNDLLDIFDERVSEQVAGDVELSVHREGRC